MMEKVNLREVQSLIGNEETLKSVDVHMHEEEEQMIGLNKVINRRIDINNLYHTSLTEEELVNQLPLSFISADYVNHLLVHSQTLVDDY